MKKVLFIFSLIFISNTSHANDGLEKALNLCTKAILPEGSEGFSYFAEGYCIGVLNQTSFLWDTTLMSRNTRICPKDYPHKYLNEVVIQLALMKRGADLISQGGNGPEPKNEEEARQQLIAKASLPPGYRANKKAPPEHFIGWAYVQTQKCD